MLRQAFLISCCLLALTACGRADQNAGYAVSGETAPAYAPAAPAPMQDGIFRGGDGRAQQIYIMTHNWWVVMPTASVQPRFDRARNYCLNDAGLDCEVQNSSINLGNQERGEPASANLTVRLPHDKIETYEKALLELLSGEADGDVTLQSRTTNAENVTQQSADIDRRLTQATDYRDRLTELSKRRDVRAPELIQIAGELSKAQTELEAIAAQKRDLANRVAKETIVVSLTERPGSATFRPLVQVWHDAGDTLIDSAADALRFFISALPWIPIALGLVFMLTWLWRLVRRPKT